MIVLPKRPTSRTRKPVWEVDERHWIKWDKETPLEDGYRKDVLRIIKDNDFHHWQYADAKRNNVIVDEAFNSPICIKVNVWSSDYRARGYLLNALLRQNTEVMWKNDPEVQFFYFPVRLMDIIEKNCSRGIRRAAFIQTTEKWPRKPIVKRKREGHDLEYLGDADWATEQAMIKHPMFYVPEQRVEQIWQIYSGERTRIV